MTHYWFIRPTPWLWNLLIFRRKKIDIVKSINELKYSLYKQNPNPAMSPLPLCCYLLIHIFKPQLIDARLLTFLFSLVAILYGNTMVRTCQDRENGIGREEVLFVFTVATVSFLAWTNIEIILIWLLAWQQSQYKFKNVNQCVPPIILKAFKSKKVTKQF